MRIAAAIVDDEPLARRGIRARLDRWPQVHVVAEAGSAAEALPLIKRTRPDVLFLDVEMPGADGFHVMRELAAGERPLTIFVTAHEDFAVDAFETEALDYVLKPIDDDRFTRTMQRVLARMAQRPAPLQRLVIRDRGRAVALEPNAIDWVQSDGDYVRIFAGRHNYLHQSTLSAFGDLLPAEHFVRIHRSSIVNVARIHALEPLTNGDYRVVLTTGARLKLSRTHRLTLAQRMPSVL